jgi:2-hydroxychromene-2-carboxylate isomerase
MKCLVTLMALGLLASSASAHLGLHPIIAGSDIRKRGEMSKRCASAAASLNEKRYNKRNFERKRGLAARANTTYTITTETP